MARYPTFEEYEHKGNFEDGIKRCNELLRRNAKDAQLHTIKLQLVYAAGGDDERPTEVLNSLLAITPAVHDIRDLIAVEDAVINAPHHLNVYPRPLTAGPLVARLWENAAKASPMSAKLELLSLRFERAILDNRRLDAQQALIQLKAAQPTNRIVYMAHAALTQSLSKSSDDLSGRLAMGLARKAVSAKFDVDDPGLDCRVAGQIFALQNAAEDLEGIKGRPMAESKHVYDAFRADSPALTKVEASPLAQASTADVHSEKWFAHEVDGLKSHFTTLIGIDSLSASLKPFVLNALRLLVIPPLAIKLRRAPADATFLAVSALIWMWEKEGRAEYLLYAAYAAEMLLAYDEHIHEARLILIYLYMRLGLGSLAMRIFDSLNVKEVQHDTIGHTLFTRLSSTHPHTTSWGGGKDAKVDPMERTAQALKTYVRCEDKLAETEASVLQHGQTGMIFDLQELRDSLRDSLPRRITILEHRKIARFRSNDVGNAEAAHALGPRVTANWLELRDSRDFDAAFDFGYNVERPVHGVEAVVPSKAWILSNLIADTAWCIASEKTPLIFDAERALSELQSEKATVSQDPSKEQSLSSLGLTIGEHLAGDVACQTLTLLLALQKSRGADESGGTSTGAAVSTITAGVDNVIIGKQSSEGDVVSLISKITAAIEQLNIETLATCQDIYTERLQDHYLYSDILSVVVLAVRYARSRAGAAYPIKLQNLQHLAKRQLVLLQEHATKQQEFITTRDVSELLASDSEIWDTLGLIRPKSDRTAWCEKMVESAREGWKGVSIVQSN